MPGRAVGGGLEVSITEPTVAAAGEHGALAGLREIRQHQTNKYPKRPQRLESPNIPNYGVMV